MKALPPRVQIDEQDGFVKPCLIQKHLPYRAQNFGETLLKIGSIANKLTQWSLQPWANKLKSTQVLCLVFAKAMSYWWPTLLAFLKS